MPVRVHLPQRIEATWFTIKWLLLGIPLGIATGSACALFLWSLDAVTTQRLANPWLLYGLPVAGLVVAFLYQRFGKSVEAGNNLIVDEIHQPGGGIPFRMLPLVLLGTIITHLCGGSAGREGTAVQMGGSIASELSRRFRWLTSEDTQRFLTAGIAAGFGGVFGTPVAGTIFAMEVLVIGRLHYAALWPCLVASVVSDQTCVAWGIGHTHYHVASWLPADAQAHLAPLYPGLLAGTFVAGILFGLAGLLFAELTHIFHGLFRKFCPAPLLRPVVGGLLVIALVWLLGTRDYLGLGVSSPDPSAVTIVRCFEFGGAHPWSWFWKIVFTAVTLSSGFKGGEVTPLFFIGAALGNTLAWLTGAPVDFFAALGFVAVFAGATNTPLACTVMAIELFGSEFGVYYAVACCMAYLSSGHNGIYLSQRIGRSKFEMVDHAPDETLRSDRDATPPIHRWKFFQQWSSND